METGELTRSPNPVGNIERSVHMSICELDKFKRACRSLNTYSQRLEYF